MKFSYQARSKEGKIERGTIEASSYEAAAALLQKYNIFVISLKEVKTAFPSLGAGIFRRKASGRDLAIFSRQLAVMIDSRVPVVQSLLSLAAQTTKADFREKITRISELVEEGNNLSEAFSSFPDVFDTFYISLIKSGEASGKISESLYYISNHLERNYDISAKVKGALIYPALVLMVLAVVIIVVMVVVIPKLTIVLQDVGGEIPLMTRMLIGFYNFMIYYGWIMLIAFAGLVAFLVYYLRTGEGGKVYDKTILKIPFLREFLEKVFLVRFAQNLSTLITAGIPITRALKITKSTIGNFVFRNIVAETEEEVSSGEKISSVLVRYPELIPSFVIQMIKVGEETGKLDKTLMEIVNFYQKDIERAIDAFMTLIEPILIIVLGIVVAFLAISVISPMYTTLSSI
jgi:type IV pilus assembly protein PilC